MSRYIVRLALLALTVALLPGAALAGDPPAPAAGSDPAPAESPAPPADAAPATQASDDGKAHCTLSVPGMHCGGCAKQVTKKASAVDGVSKVEVRLGDHEVDLSYDPAKTSPEKLKAIVSELYEATIKEPSAAPAAGETTDAPAEDVKPEAPPAS